MLLDGCVDGQPAQRPLTPGSFYLGGGPEDDWSILGLPPRGVRFDLQGDSVTVEATAPVEVQGEPLVPGQRRLLLPDERISWAPGCWLALRTIKPVATPFTRTAQLVRGLLRGEDVGEAVATSSLIGLTGRDLGRIFFLTELEEGTAWELGRGAGAAIRLRDRSVSRRHGRILRREGERWLEDLGGPNGLTLNGQPVTAPASLQDGDVLGLGYTRLKYRAPSLVQMAASEPPSPAVTDPEPGPTATLQALPWPALPSDRWLTAFFLVATFVGLWCAFRG